MKRIVWIDKETGGLSPDKQDITQIAAILDVDGQIVEEINLLMRPDPARVEAGALAVQKKTLEQVLAHPLSQKEGFDLFKAALDRWTAEGKADWGGQNTVFDIGFSKALFKTHGDEGGLSRYFTGETVDTLYIMNDLRKQRKVVATNSKLGTICVVFGVVLGDAAHCAVADIRATRQAFYAMREKCLVP